VSIRGEISSLNSAQKQNNDKTNGQENANKFLYNEKPKPSSKSYKKESFSYN